MSIENAITNIVNHTIDSVLKISAEDMGITSLVTLEGDELTVNLSTGFPSAFLKETFLPQLKGTINDAYPNHRLTITLDHFIKAHRTQLAGKGLRGIKNTIAIASGKGGVGKSTVSVNLAIALARAGARVGILDADIYGPSIPLMLGKTTPVQIHGDKYLPIMAHGIQAMSIGYLTQGEQPLIWRGPMLAKSLIQMIDITEWDDLDYLFIDLPPGTGDIQLSLVQKIPLTGAIVVTTPQNVATLDAQKALKMFATTGIDVIGIIENMSLHTCVQCGHQEAIFSHGGAEALCRDHDCKLLGQLPLDKRIASQCDIGIPSTVSGQDDIAWAFIKAGLHLSIELSKKELNYANRFPPIVVE